MQTQINFCAATVLICLLSLLPHTLRAETFLSVSLPDTVVRNQQLLRIDISTNHPSPQILFPLRLKISLFLQNQILNEKDIDLPTWESLSQGIIYYFTMPEHIYVENLRCLVTLHDVRQNEISRVEIQRKTIAHLQQRFNHAVVAVSQKLNTSALAHLRLEQLALLLQKQMSLAELKDIERYFTDIDLLISSTDKVERLSAHQQHFVAAYQSQSDGSWQPYRLHLPPQGTSQALLVCCVETPSTLNKAQWPGLDPAWIQHAQRQGFACLEVYPAGDHEWLGLSAQRIVQTIAAARAIKPELSEQPICLLGSGLGCNGALRAAMLKPKLFRAILLDQCPKWTENSYLQQHWLNWLEQSRLSALGEHPFGFCQNASALLSALNPHRPDKQQGLLTRIGLGELKTPEPWQWLQTNASMALISQRKPTLGSHFSDRPFICIQGSGEHLEAKQVIQDILFSVRGAWVRHSQGDLPVVSDQMFDSTLYPHHNFIFIGNPLDNKALRDFIAANSKGISPLLGWDLRELRYPQHSILRSQIGALQWHFTVKQRECWVLDGSQLRLPIGPLPLQNAQSKIRSRSGEGIWHSE